MKSEVWESVASDLSGLSGRVLQDMQEKVRAGGKVDADRWASDVVEIDRLAGEAYGVMEQFSVDESALRESRTGLIDLIRAEHQESHVDPETVCSHGLCAGMREVLGSEWTPSWKGRDEG